MESETGSPAPASPGGEPPKAPLPDPGDAPMAPKDERYPFYGKMACPTSVPSPAARMENLNRKAKAGRRKKFLLALLAGQLLVLLLDVGGEKILALLRGKVQYRGAFPLRSMVFIGMTSMIVAIALLLFLILGYKAARYLFGDKKIGFFTAIGLGIRRVWNETWALGLILGVIGGTAWFLISSPDREDLKAKGLQYLEKGRSLLTPGAPAPPGGKKP